MVQPESNWTITIHLELASPIHTLTERIKLYALCGFLTGPSCVVLCIGPYPLRSLASSALKGHGWPCRETPRCLEGIPPTRAALEQHVKRCTWDRPLYHPALYHHHVTGDGLASSALKGHGWPCRETPRCLEGIPPTRAALEQHVKRCTYQGGYCWGQTLVPSCTLPSPCDWGWVENEGQFEPLWTTLPEAAKSCYELISCGCKKGYRGRCKCKKAALKCTGLCYCEGECQC